MGRDKKFNFFNWRYILQIAIITVVYYISAKLGLILAFVNPSATAIWPPTGIAIAVLLFLGKPILPAIFLGAFLANVTTAGSVITSIFIATGNTLEGWLGAYLIKRFAKGKKVLQDVDTVLRFTFLAGMIAPSISATIGVLTLHWGGLLMTGAFGQTWLTWWLGDFGGALIVAPLIINWWELKEKLDWRKVAEVVVMFISIAVIGEVIFQGFFPFAYAAIPVLLWAVFRFGQRGGSAAVILLAAIAVYHTLNGTGPFVEFSRSINSALILLQIYLSTTSVTMMVVGATLFQRKLVEEKLAHEKAEDDALLASIGDGILATDREGRIILVNQAFETLLGWKRAEVIGKSTVQILVMQNDKGAYIPSEERPLKQAMGTKQRKFLTCYLMRKDGTKFPVMIVATPVILDGEIVGGIKIFHDITKEKEVDKAKTEFVLLASHQLRTPLSIVRWYVELLGNKKTGDLNTKQKKYLKEIGKASSRMSALAETLLMISRLEAGGVTLKTENIDLKSFVGRVLTELGPQVKEKELLIKEQYNQGKRVSLVTDPKLLNVILQNLLSNAVKYTKPQGHVWVSATVVNKELIIKVKDDGYGIPENEKSKIFTKMYRASNISEVDPQGNGLGLYMIKSILTKMGGSIEFESEENKRSTFTVSLPVS